MSEADDSLDKIFTGLGVALGIKEDTDAEKEANIKAALESAFNSLNAALQKN